MPKSLFVICGPDDDAGEPQWWDNANGWTSDFTEATPFDDTRILTVPLPPGGVGVMEFVENEPVRFMKATDLPPWGIPCMI